MNLFNFKIEYYLRTNKYFVRYKFGYLSKDYYTGLVSITWQGKWNATPLVREKDAEDLIMLYKEQRFKETVQIKIFNKQ